VSRSVGAGGSSRFEEKEGPGASPEDEGALFGLTDAALKELIGSTS